MSDSGSSEQILPKLSGSDSASLKRGGLGLVGGLLLCGAAILAQAALLHAISGKKAN